MQIVTHLDESVWRDYVARHPSGNIFLTPEMLEVFSLTKNHHPGLWAALDTPQQVLALFLPVRITLSPAMRSLTTRTVSYGSVLHDPTPQGREALSRLLNAYRKEERKSSLFSELRNLSDMSDDQSVLAECGFFLKEELNFLIPLDRPADQILQNIGKRTRKNIRRGLRRGRIEISEVDDREKLSEWYALLAQTYRRAGLPLADRSLFEAVFDILVPKNMAAFMSGRIDGRLAVCSLELMFKDTIFGWYGGMDRRFSRENPSELLMWDVLRRGSENGFRVYDFGLAGSPGKPYGVRDFKAKFGGELVCFGRNICTHKPVMMMLSRWGFSGLKRLKRFLHPVGKSNPVS